MGSYPFILIFALFTLNPVTISVYPQVSLSRPATFRITVLVPREATNREICYGFVGPEEKRSCIGLAGEEARRAWTVFWDVRTAGDYEAVAVLTRVVEGQTRTHRSVQPFRVIGLEP